MRVWEGVKISGSDFEIRATNFKKQATNFLFAPNPSPQRAKTTFRFLTLAERRFDKAF